MEQNYFHCTGEYNLRFNILSSTAVDADDRRKSDAMTLLIADSSDSDSNK